MELERKNEFDEFVEFVESGELRENNEAGIQRGDERMDSPAKPENDPSAALRVNNNNEADLPPEYCRYRDEGCELAESCLNCPFAKCIYDEPGGKQRWMKRLRARELARLHIIERKTVKELSERFGISQRTVQRALKAARGGSKGLG